MRAWCRLLLFVMCLVPLHAHGFVAVQNGNYFTGFTDLELHGAVDKSVRVSRSYNSRAQFLGMFGYGWGNDFDAFLLQSADGSVVIQESGGGEKARFERPGFNAQELEFLIRRVVEARAAKSSSDPHFSRAHYQSRLMNDASFRDEQARELNQTRDLPLGTVLYSRRSKQKVTRLATGYVRETDDGSKEYFEHKGTAFDQGVDARTMRKLKNVYKITKIESTNPKRTITLTYDPSTGNLLKVSTSIGEYFQFEYGGLGVVSGVKDNSGQSASYEYCASVAYSAEHRCQQGDLTLTKDAADGVYRYAYDNLHNLIEILGPDQSKETIEYWSVASAGAGGVRTVTRDGLKWEYDYWMDPASAELHYRTTVLTTYASGNMARATYEYWNKRRQDGSTYRSRLVSRVDGQETETIYNECCGQPEKITSGSSVIEYEYEADTGLVKEKRAQDEIVSWSYSDKFRGKITRHAILNRATRKLLSQTSFEYDGDGRLSVARSSSGRGVSLNYDADGRINELVDENRNRLRFEYGAGGKPIRISLEGVGTIEMSYDAKGNIKDVQTVKSGSPTREDRAIAVKVAGMFQFLLELLKPAGIAPL